jgi:glucose/arabinose dehydrogenase
VTGLAQPTGAAFLPDGRLVVTEKGGTLRVWTAAGGLREAPLLTLPVCTASEMGLLGVAVDPAFAVNGSSTST